MVLSPWKISLVFIEYNAFITPATGKSNWPFFQNCATTTKRNPIWTFAQGSSNMHIMTAGRGIEKDEDEDEDDTTNV
jgi:hypothetical protein